MKLLETVSEVSEVKEHALLACRLTHTIKESKGVCDYRGPRFSREMWDGVLAFFCFSYAKTHGESQVRLFVHPQQGWRAWAFPQGALSGMSTTELPDDPRTKEQRAQFGDDWILYGTVHHHCNASAFQSGTDQTNEKTQEGIHITVGNITDKLFTIDCRFYYRGCKFKPDMSQFWDIGGEALGKVKELENFFHMTMSLHTLAESQMCLPPPRETQFPKEWAENLVEKKWETRGTGYWEYEAKADADFGYKGYPTKVIKGLRKFFRAAYKEDIAANKGMTDEIRLEIDGEVESLLDYVAGDGGIEALATLCDKHNTNIAEVMKRWNELKIIEVKEPPVDEPDEEEQPETPAGNGTSSYAGSEFFPDNTTSD